MKGGQRHHKDADGELAQQKEMKTANTVEQTVLRESCSRVKWQGKPN